MRPSLARLPGSFVLVAADLTPSEAAELDWERVLAVATDAGLADPPHVDPGPLVRRSRPWWACRTPRAASRRSRWWWWTARAGRWSSSPASRSWRLPRRARSATARRTSALQAHARCPRVTRDGVRGLLLANVEFPEDAAHGAAVRRGGHRPLPLRVPARPRAPLAGRGAADTRCTGGCSSRSRPHPVTVRTWDVGPEDLAPGRPDAARTRRWASARCACCAARPSPSAPSSARLLRPRPARPAAHHVPLRDGAERPARSCSTSWRTRARGCAATAWPSRRTSRSA